MGATSALAVATARLLAMEGASFCLVARDAAKLEEVALDLKVRGATEVKLIVADMSSVQDAGGLLEKVRSVMAGIDLTLIAHGVLGDKAILRQDPHVVAHTIFVNFTSIAMFLTSLANHLEESRRGTLVVISSVAGDRGRQGNYVYGASKAALDAYLSGLRARLFPAGVQVLTIKPGFVASPMTAHLRQNFLYSSPEQVARGMLKAINLRRDVVYLPFFWGPIMWVIRSIPEIIFKRLKL